MDFDDISVEVDAECIDQDFDDIDLYGEIMLEDNDDSGIEFE